MDVDVRPPEMISVAVLNLKKSTKSKNIIISSGKMEFLFLGRDNNNNNIGYLFCLLLHKLLSPPEMMRQSAQPQETLQREVGFVLLKTTKK